jgi:DMSO reductase anchor subunit
MQTQYLITVAVVGSVLLTSLFKQVDFSARVKSLIAVVVSVGLAALVAWKQGLFGNTEDVFQAITAVYAFSQLAYQFLLKGTSLDATLEAVGDPSNPGPA